jgi:hypothetical protein
LQTQSLRPAERCTHTPPHPLCQLGYLLSYLAQSLPETPPTLVVGVPLPEWQHHVAIVAAQFPAILPMPIPALTSVPSPLALGVPARHLPVTNSWIGNEGPTTLGAAAVLCCFFHPGMVPDLPRPPHL